VLSAILSPALGKIDRRAVAEFRRRFAFRPDIFRLKMPTYIRTTDPAEHTRASAITRRQPVIAGASK
jgi:hypothetical protein